MAWNPLVKSAGGAERGNLWDRIKSETDMGGNGIVHVCSAQIWYSGNKITRGLGLVLWAVVVP